MLRTSALLVVTVVLMAAASSCARADIAASEPSGSARIVSNPAIPSVAVLSSPAASAPIVVKSSQPFASAQQDTGDLRQFVQASATTWWAVVGGNLTGQTFIVRSADGGRHWQDVTPATVHTTGAFDVNWYFLDAQHGWLAAAPTGASTVPLYSTRDGGLSWQQIGALPEDCVLDFVDATYGWCSELWGAGGSMPVTINRTEDGGSTWQLVSRTAVDPDPSTAGALPFGCDKSLTFTSPNVGWASSFCSGGQPYLETSADGGARWHSVTPVPLPVAAGGAGLSLPVVDGADVAVANLGGLGPGVSGISTSSDGGRSWRNHLLPVPQTNQYWNVDLIDVSHWRATDGDVIMATDDAGAHWRRWAPSVSMHDQFGTLTLDFISPDVGSAREPAANGPLWTTVDGGLTWTKVVIRAGPYTVQ
jgi:photosystem II stability/assembly factor-like uncharacterized protein